MVTRFAPSPTGDLHVGGARTALFNWLFARSRGGRFLLRIEDTDRVRSTADASRAIIEGLAWLGLDWDGEAVSQFSRQDIHRQAAESLVAAGKAYRCFSSVEEIAESKAAAKRQQRPELFESPWRNVPETEHPDRPFSVRLATPRSGETVVNDVVYGQLTWKNETLDDMIILRSDGTPTYNFAVVVDDREMKVSHVIRGDDHLPNTARQLNVYSAFGWMPPVFAHVPLILDEQGRKLSKRSGDPGLDAYSSQGFPAAAVRNYLARLGWSHGNDEFFSTEQAILWFDLSGLRRSAARLDRRKLENLSKQHLARTADEDLARQLTAYRTGAGRSKLDHAMLSKVLRAMPAAKIRAKTLKELENQLQFIWAIRPIKIDDKAKKLLGESGSALLARFAADLQMTDWSEDALRAAIEFACAREEVGFGKIAQPARAALTGQSSSPGVIDVMLVLGRSESLGRINDALQNSAGSVAEPSIST